MSRWREPLLWILAAVTLTGAKIALAAAPTLPALSLALCAGGVALVLGALRE